MIIGIEGHGDPDLFQVVDAKDAARLFLGHRQRRQQHGGKNRDDRQYDQKFDQGKRAQTRTPESVRLRAERGNATGRFCRPISFHPRLFTLRASVSQV